MISSCLISSALIVWATSVVCSTVVTATTTTAFAPIGQPRCTKPVLIQIPECRNTFYNLTGMPNLIGQETQFDAQHQLQTFRPLITYQCSSKLSFFLCSVYTPMCDAATRHLIGPCRPLCEHVMARCAPVLRIFDFDWPPSLNCSRFPVKNVVGGTMCMEGPQDSDESPMLAPINDQAESILPVSDPVKVVEKPSKQAMSNSDGTIPKMKDDNLDVEVQRWIDQVNKYQLPDSTSPTELGPTGRKSSISVLAKSLRHCSYLKKPTFYVYVNRTGRCAPLCEADILFTRDAKLLATIWTGLLAGICGLLTLTTLISYAVKPTSFRVAERPVIYIALCQLMHAFSYGLSLSLGRQTVGCGLDVESGREIRLQEGLDNRLCALVFMLHYFFSIASLIWWVLLSFNWTLQCSQCCWCTLCATHFDSTVTSVWRSSEPPLRSDSPVTSCCLRFDVSRGGGGVCRSSNETSPAPSSSWDVAPAWTDHIDDGWVATETNNASPRENGVGGGATGATGATTIPTLAPSSGGLNGQAHSIQRTSREMASFFVQNGKLVPSQASNGLYRLDLARSVHDKATLCMARQHVLVWLTAGLLTVGVLVSRQVDSDELIPICSVGRQNTQAMGAFVIGPEIILTTLGSLTLLVGLLLAVYRHWRGTRDSNLTRLNNPVSISDNSRLLRHSPTEAHRWSSTPRSGRNGMAKPHLLPHSGDRSLGLRLGLFCLLQLFPTLCITGCNLWEFLRRDQWLRANVVNPRSDMNRMLPFPPRLWRPGQVVGPSPELLMLRIFMSLVTGFTCTLWVWSIKGCFGCCYRGRFRQCQKLDLPCSKQKSIAGHGIQEDGRLSGRSGPMRPNTVELNGLPGSTGTNSNPAASSVHPYAIYQHRLNSDWTGPLRPCVVQTSVAASAQGSVEAQHSNATTPGYYSQAKVGSTIEPHFSDTFSEESTAPPPLPVASRPQRLTPRGDPCVGASSSTTTTIQAGSTQPNPGAAFHCPVFPNQ